MFKTKLQVLGWALIMLGMFMQHAYALPPAIMQYSTNGPGGVGTLSPPISRWVNTYALSANTAETITWPTGALWCNISASAAYWVNANTTATIPNSDVTTGLASMLNMGQRMKGVESGFSIISATNQQISVEFWGQ
jgi:hypothetical protein